MGRRLLGVAVLVLGTGALGFWADRFNAREMENAIGQAASAVAAGSIHGVTTATSGRDIIATGIADTAAERDALIAALNEVEGRRVVVDELTILPAANPYETVLEKGADGVLVAGGNAPDAGNQATVAAGFAPVAELPLASGVADRALWRDGVLAGAAALEPLDFGTAKWLDGVLTVEGQARTPAEAEAAAAALAGLPEGTANLDLTLLDDGSPAVWTLAVDADDGARLTGKLPLGLEGAMIADAAGISDLTDEAARGLIAPPVTDLSLVAAARPWLGQVEEMRLTSGPAGRAVYAGFGAGADLQLLDEAVSQSFAGIGGVAVEVGEVAGPGAEGASRINFLTGAREVLSGGYWLPALDFTPTAAVCMDEANAILSAQSVNFVSGSDRLDADARGVISRLAAVVLPCTGAGGLTALIGGHTDSTGDAAMNLDLSQRRAEAVRAALIARGVPAADLSATGYGDSLPIASNDTEDGKAANRRTTIDWSE